MRQADRMIDLSNAFCSISDSGKLFCLLISSFWGVKQRPVRRADNLTAICEPTV
jgi:hypothetical protein